MAEFRFYGTSDDCQNLLSQLFAAEYKLIPNRSYPTPAPDLFVGLDERLLRAIDTNRLLYILGPFTLQPPFMNQLRSGEYRGRYVVDLSRGGPLLSLSLPGCTLDRGVAKLVSGSLFLPPNYWDDQIERSIRPSESVKEHFAALKRIITKETVPRRAGGNVRIGREGARLFEAGRARIQFDGKWISRE